MMKRIYFGYPYSSDPKLRTDEIVALIRQLLEVRHDFVPLVPHIMFDALLGFPGGYDHTYVLSWEYEIIGNVADYICFPPAPDGVPISVGCVWESWFAWWYGTPEVDWDYLLDGGDI